MIKTIIVSEKAEKEIRTATVWYDKQLLNLGNRFIEELTHHFNKIQKNPGIYKKVIGDIQRCLMKIFLTLFSL